VIHDCFGAILRAGDGLIALLSAESGKVYAVLDKEGLHVIKRRGREKEENVISLRALKRLIFEIERAEKEGGKPQPEAER
jgi:hypothetical protein